MAKKEDAPCLGTDTIHESRDTTHTLRFTVKETLNALRFTVLMEWAFCFLMFNTLRLTCPPKPLDLHSLGVGGWRRPVYPQKPLGAGGRFTLHGYRRTIGKVRVDEISEGKNK